jgi:hypothetical protein
MFKLIGKKIFLQFEPKNYGFNQHFDQLRYDQNTDCVIHLWSNHHLTERRSFGNLAKPRVCLTKWLPSKNKLLETNRNCYVMGHWSFVRENSNITGNIHIHSLYRNDSGNPFGNLDASSKEGYFPSTWSDFS